METPIPNNFHAEPDAGAIALFEQQQRELNKHRTRYIFLPLFDAACYQVPGGYVPAGAIYPLAAPKGFCNVRDAA